MYGEITVGKLSKQIHPLKICSHFYYAAKEIPKH